MGELIYASLVYFSDYQCSATNLFNTAWKNKQAPAFGKEKVLQQYSYKSVQENTRDVRTNMTIFLKISALAT